MNCKKCDKEVFASDTGKEPKAFMAMKPENSNDVRCLEHRNQ